MYFYFVCVCVCNLILYTCIFIGEQINNLESLSFKISMQTLLFNGTLLCTFVARMPYSCICEDMIRIGLIYNYKFKKCSSEFMLGASYQNRQ